MIFYKYKLQTTAVLGWVVIDSSTASLRSSWYLSQRMTRSVNIVPGGDKKVRDNSPKANIDSPKWIVLWWYAEEHSTNTERAEKDNMFLSGMVSLKLFGFLPARSMLLATTTFEWPFRLCRTKLDLSKGRRP